MPTSPKQNKSYCEATHRFNIWIGAVRSGKTHSSIERFIEDLKNGPKGDAMIIGVNRSTIHRNILSHLYKRLGFPCPSPMSNKAILYGRDVYFVGAPDVSAVTTIQGSTLALAYVDEATCIPEPFWKMLETRLSVPGAKLLATANPQAPAHWLKKQYLDRQDVHDLIYWNFHLDDNPALDEAYKNAIKSSFTGVWHRRFILGEWCQATGGIYPDFDHDNMYTHPYPSPTYYLVGIDYGTTNATAAVLCAISPNEWPQVKVEQEYYYDSAARGRPKTDAELVRDIKDFIGYKNVTSIYIDPAAASFKIALRQADLPVLDANNDVLLGIKITNKFISGKNIVVQAACKNLIEQIQSYAWCPKASDRGEDKPIKKDDHICVVGDTKLKTDLGEVCIKDLIGHLKGYACSYHQGKGFLLTPIKNASKTGENKTILKLVLQNGKTLKATPDHKVLTKRGFIEIQFLLKTDEVLCIDEDKSNNEIHNLEILTAKEHVEENVGVYSLVKSVEPCENEDVYCISIPETGNFVANGIVVKNCDALRYALTPFMKTGEFSNPDEQLSYDQLRRKVFADDDDIYSHFNFN